MTKPRTRLLCRALLPAALLAWWAAACPAATQDPAAWRRWDGWDVSAFDVSGAPPDLAAELKSGLGLAGRRKVLRGLVRPPFKASSLVQDMRRTRLFLAARGYPASRVEAAFVPDPGGRRIGVVLQVTPGPEVRITGAALLGWPAETPGPASDDPMLPTAGARFSDAAVQQGLQHLLVLLQDAGYAQVRIEPAVLPAAGGKVRVEYRITAGDHYRITEVDLHGCSDDLLPLARRVADVRPGSEFGGTKLADAALDLRTTQLFSLVELSTEPIGPGELRLDAALADARMREWSASVGSWSDNPWQVKAGWVHRNLLGGGRGFRAGGVYAANTRRLGAEVFKPGLLSPRALTRLGGEWIREDEDAYRSTEYAAILSQSFRPRGRGLWQLGVSVSNIDVVTFAPDAASLPVSQEWLLEIWIDRKWDWTDDLLYPTRGGSLRLTGAFAPRIALFGSSYVSGEGEAVRLTPLGPLGVGAARVRAGWSRPLNDSTDLLANRRFYAGGYNSMRGYGRRRLGPRDADDNPRGGQALLLAGAELRRPLVWIFAAAVFVETGNVWRTPDAAALADLQTAWGADLDVRTPLGPLRMGHSWIIGEPLAGEPRRLWHFGIGYPW